MTELLVRELTQNDCEQIAKLFCTDNLLRNELNFQEEDMPSAKEVSEKYQNWCKSKSAVPYAIVLNTKTTIGCICLSRIDLQSEPARIAGWIASNYRGLGYGKVAINKVQLTAKNLGISNIKIIGIEND